MKELLNTINNIKNNGILTPINIFTKKDENKIIKKILNSDKFKEIYPNTDKEKSLSIIKCNFGLLASKEENNNYNHEFLVYDNGGSKEIFLYFEGSRARKWSLENEIIEVQETKIYKDIDNSIVQAATKENKNSLGVENMNAKKELRPIFNADIKGHEEYQKEEFKKYNSGALNFTHKRINNNMIDEYTKYFVYKDNTFMSVKPSKAGYTSGYYEHVRKYNYKVDHVNKIILFTDKEIEEIEPIKEEFYNNNEVEPAAEQIEGNYFYSDINLNNILKHIEEVKQFNNSKSIEYFGNYATPQRGSFRIEKNNNNFYIKAMIETKENYFEKLEIFETPEKAIDLYIDFLSKYQLDYIKYLESQKKQTEKENNQYITLTKEQEKERIDLINLWSKKAPEDKEQGKERFLQLLFEYQEQKKTKEEFKKHINKLYAANKNIKAANAGKKDFNNYLIDLLATENILQQNDIIKNEFFTNAYNYIKSVS